MRCSRGSAERVLTERRCGLLAEGRPATLRRGHGRPVRTCPIRMAGRVKAVYVDGERRCSRLGVRPRPKPAQVQPMASACLARRRGANELLLVPRVAHGVVARRAG
ncbi:MAG: hypothetical protein MZU91_14745 [Desulfosudis oleivorans]|nr:hypothetical protein [Desulfosudis oleivorans]